MSGSTSPEYEDRYLMATAESMLRAGHGHKEIERALRRMSRDAPKTGPTRRSPRVEREPTSGFRTGQKPDKGPAAFQFCKRKAPLSRAFLDGACRDRTGDLRLAKPALSQLSYAPSRPIEGRRQIPRRLRARGALRDAPAR